MKVERWAKISDWSPASPKQVLEYVTHKKYPIHRHRKTKKPTTNNEALEKTLRKFPTDEVIPRILACRDLQKADGYLSDKYVGRDGRFHPEIGRHPKTLRYSASAPNVTNQPKPDKYEKSADPRHQAKAVIAQEVVGSIEASPGMILIERDYKAEESLLLGYFAGDANYMRMARLGIYSYFLALKQGISIDLGQSDEVVRKQLGVVKKQFPFEYPIMKKTILARGYGEGVPAIAKDLEPFFLDAAKEQAALSTSKRQGLVFEICSKLAREAAVEYVRIYEAAAPKVVEFQHNIRMQAHKERRLVNPFGYPMNFWEVFKKVEGKWRPGGQANEALAFLPQSSGAGILTEAMLELDARLDGEPFHLLIPEHDKLVAECPEGSWQHYMAIMKEVMEAPIPLLGGLTIETEGKVGKNWGDMHECA